jgi:ribosomal protein S18 acetylase RimI-like enzyme
MNTTSLISIRGAAPDEAPAIAAVLQAAFLVYQPLYTPGGFGATTPTETEIRRRWDEGPVWVAVQEMVVVGTVAAVLRDRGCYVRSMAVLPAARGLGLGGRLLEQVEAFAVAQGAPRLYLSTTPFLAAAIRLYEQAGFRRTDEEPHALFGTPLFTMVKPLPPLE